MSVERKMAPAEEQEICLTCGFCCDGTLFCHGSLQPGERGHLPELMEKGSFSINGNDYFMMPCNYFDEKCIIYKTNRAIVCSSYRCQLLKDFAEGKVDRDDALEIIQKARQMRSELIELFMKMSGKKSVKTFRQLLSELGRISKTDIKDESLNSFYDLLVARCNILEALLIKHIRSASDFESMMTDESG